MLHPTFPWWEWQYLKFIRRTLTEHWIKIQGGSGEEPLRLWHLIFMVLELNKNAQKDLLLLAQSGLVGRAMANKALWDLCSHWALDPAYEDVSHKASWEVAWARRAFDRLDQKRRGPARVDLGPT